MMELHTTFTLLRQARACQRGYATLARALGGVKKYGEEKPIAISFILKKNGFSDALWSLRAVLKEEEAERDKILRLLACDFAEHVLPIFESKDPNNRFPRESIAAARRFPLGKASVKEVLGAHSRAAYADANAAAFTAYVNADASAAAVYAVTAAAFAAEVAAFADFAADAAAYTSAAANDAVAAAAFAAKAGADDVDDAWEAERHWQQAQLDAILVQDPE